jgi:hypothetical protein
MKLPTLFSLLMAASNGFVAILVYTNLQPIIPLFYTLPQLDQQLTSKEFIFILPAMAVSFFLINFFCGKILSQIDFLMMQLLSWVSVLLQFLLLFALIRIIIII